MNLKELIYKRLSEAEGIVRYLTRYQGRPAVFYQEAPADNLEGWEGMAPYPRVLFDFSLQADEEGICRGELAVFLYCPNTADTVPEAIEEEIKGSMEQALLKPEGDAVYGFSWTCKDALTFPEGKREFIMGSDIRFAILEYTNQETTDPDPIGAANLYLKSLYPESLVAGLDRMGEITETAKEAPVLYVRLASVKKAEETNSTVWMDCNIAIHILCPDRKIRSKMAAAIANRLSLEGEIILLDASPMFIKRLQVNNKSGYQKNGQICMTGHYGLPRYRAKPHRLVQTHVKEK